MAHHLFSSSQGVGLGLPQQQVGEKATGLEGQEGFHIMGRVLGHQQAQVGFNLPGLRNGEPYTCSAAHREDTG